MDLQLVKNPKNIPPEKKSSNNGGFREGSGRKPKEVAVRSLARHIYDHINEEERERLIERAKEMAYSDPIMMKFLLEQIYGKAAQQVIHTGADGGAVQFRSVGEVSEEFMRLQALMQS